MNSLNIDRINIEGTVIKEQEPAEKIVDPATIQIPDDLPALPGQGFGSVAMWKLRGGKKSAGSQQTTDRFSI